jgi:hypothetical protein
MFLYVSFLIVFSCLYVFVKRTTISWDVQKRVIDTLASVDDEEFSFVEDNSISALQVKPTRFRAFVVRIAKGEFGLLRRTRANQLMVQKFMRDYMREHGVRPSHIGLHLPMCVACFFIPSKQEIEAHQYGVSYIAYERDWMVRDLWNLYYGGLRSMLGFAKE